MRRKKANALDTITYYYQGGKLLSEKHSDTSKNLYYLYNGEEIIGFLKGDTEVYYYQKDTLGNVIGIYSHIGVKVASYSYDAWGGCNIGVNVNGIAELNPIRYRGYYYDDETQLYYLQTRYYDPATGRFISPDTVDYLDPETTHGLNLYAYCNNNPVMYTDPTGHAPKWWQWALLGVGAALVIGAITVLTMGVGTTVLGASTAGAILHGAAVGALIGAGAGTVAGGVIGGVTSNWSVEGVVEGAMTGLGVGAIGGAFIGGIIGGCKFQVANNLFKAYNLPSDPNYDCSEIAEDLMKLNNNRGSLMTFKAKGNASLKVLGESGSFDYHTVYKFGRYILDPRYGQITAKSVYSQAMKTINAGIQLIF